MAFEKFSDLIAFISFPANVYQVSIRPEAFQSPASKLIPSDDDGSISTDILCSDRDVPTKMNSPTFLEQQSSLNADTDSLLINSTHTLPTSPPFTFSIQGNSFNVSSTTNSMSLVPITSPIITSSTPNLSFNFLQNPQSVSSTCQLSSANNKPTTPLSSSSPISLHLLGERNSPHNSTFASPLKNNFSGLSLNNGECLQPHKPHKNHFQCKSCRGVFKPHPRPAVQPFLSVPNSPADHIQSHSNLSYPERPQLYSLLPTSHVPSDTYSPASSSTTYYATSTQPTPTKKQPDLSERKFHCPICERSYKSNTGLKRHLIVHSGERPFQCHYCFKSFYRKYVLTTHIDRVHNKIFASSQS